MHILIPQFFMEQFPHVTRHASATPSTAHRWVVALLPTQVQSLEIFLPFQVNLKRDVESSHSSQESHVSGHIADTPSAAHLSLVALLATQVQSRLILLFL